MGRGGLAERILNRPCECQWHYTDLTLPVADSHHSSEWSPHHARYSSLSSSTRLASSRSESALGRSVPASATATGRGVFPGFMRAFDHDRPRCSLTSGGHRELKVDFERCAVLLLVVVSGCVEWFALARLGARDCTFSVRIVRRKSTGFLGKHALTGFKRGRARGRGRTTRRLG
jgi:hypothetical protein